MITAKKEASRVYKRITVYISRKAPWCHYLVAGLLLMTMYGLSITSMAHDSAIVDEVAHIPAGYSYLHFGDYRLNPEHPPLIKDLSAVPLQFMHLQFPSNEPAWTTDVNGQWETGWNFLYHLGNNASEILFWSRLPILLLAVAFGAIMYGFLHRRYGSAAALLALFGYAFSPNILAHSHYVTTDLGASAFMFLGMMAFIKFVEAPNRSNLIILSLGLAGAQLAKFSAVLLYPFFALMAIAISLLWRTDVSLWRRLRTYLGGLIAASFGSLGWIYLYYAPHVINMPAQVQARLIDGALVSGPVALLNGPLKWMGQYGALRPLAQYFLGLAMVYGRVAGGNVTYFLGDVTDQSFKAYFPVLFATKTQIPLLLALLVIVGLAIWRTVSHRARWRTRLAKSLHIHFAEWLFWSFIVFYFSVAVVGNLDLGIRHILPIYPPLFAVIAISIVRLMRNTPQLKHSQLAGPVAIALLLWYAGSAVFNHPNYLSYFNELIGGPKNADAYFSDSSVDWGQDLLRFRDYLDAHPEIDKVALDYFGGADPRYYFCPRIYNADGTLVADSSGYDCSNSRYVEWHAQYGPYTGKWIAVSETFLENDRYYAKLYNRGGYEYLRAMQPVAKIGNSIYLYKLK